MAAESENQDQTDKRLLEQIQQGDQLAAQEIFSRYSQRLLTTAHKRLAGLFASRVDPEDIVQSTFKSFFRRAGNGGYLAPEAGDLFNLLVNIAMRKVNARVDYHQAASRDVRKTVSVDDFNAPAINDEQKLRELMLTIEDICQPLSETQRQIIHLRLEGFSVSEIADQCGRSKRTVERELQNFRKQLCSHFEP
ncbi:MAG TPA: sigma-70 family RNA polymerase sigma factor [Pirellulaceae bacterium]|nr:sigma-70 family RNA polymerase sigma factor [Pirellulaceae bacterium]HMO93839.1 sigma-70 family RNA polymerase sigma factor [Pirellulaceae bacterium]HMP71135.1 sigma-70 family RNA polymerase sigma factor [Pirellulaceae bacterium]